MFIVDTALTLCNVVAPKRPEHAVTPQGFPGAGGLWPTYEPAREGDSRCSCPALNAMANHGMCASSNKYSEVS